MRMVFRVDASNEIGTGHVMRCLALAEVLRERGSEVCFICREFPGHMESVIRQNGFEVIMLPVPEGRATADPEGTRSWSWLGETQRVDAEKTCEAVQRWGGADWLVVDHYGIDHRWESTLRKVAENIVVVDDLADRRHDCDVLLDQTYGRIQIDYSGLVPAHARLLLGSKYALLRREFAHWRPRALARRQRQRAPRRLFVNFGGTDVTNTTELVLNLLGEAKFDLPPELVVVLGASSLHRQKIHTVAAKVASSVTVLSRASNMAEIMSTADVAIGAAGATSWERCCLGLPSIVMVVADNQLMIAEELDRAGAAFFSGTRADVEREPERLLKPLHALLIDLETAAKVSRRAASITDGHGAERVALALLSCESENDPAVTLRNDGKSL